MGASVDVHNPILLDFGNSTGLFPAGRVAVLIDDNITNGEVNRHSVYKNQLGSCRCRVFDNRILQQELLRRQDKSGSYLLRCA